MNFTFQVINQPATASETAVRPTTASVRHPHPKRAVSFALMMLSSSLIELILVDHDLSNWQQVIPKDGQSLRREWLRAFLSYLGVEPPRS